MKKKKREERKNERRRADIEEKAEKEAKQGEHSNMNREGKRLLGKGWMIESGRDFKDVSETRKERHDSCILGLNSAYLDRTSVIADRPTPPPPPFLRS